MQLKKSNKDQHQYNSVVKTKKIGKDAIEFLTKESSKILEQIKIDNLRFYVSLEDYFTFTNYEGLDPEAGSTNNQSQGIDRGVYPIPGKVIFGLSLNL